MIKKKKELDLTEVVDKGRVLDRVVCIDELLVLIVPNIFEGRGDDRCSGVASHWRGVDRKR